MKVKFIGLTDLTSKGINFVNGGVYDLKPEVVEYLKNTFGNIEILETTKEKATEVVKEVLEAVKEEAKPTKK
jgi:hypothetical protein